MSMMTKNKRAPTFFPFAVVPQPVYMNMNDMALLKQKKLQQQQIPEDSPDLKTPTAEDQLPVPEQKVLKQVVKLFHIWPHYI